jgi:hypothetical protein
MPPDWQANARTAASALDEAYIISTRTLLDLRYNYTRYVDNMAPPSAGIDLAALGFSRTFVNQILGVDARNLMLPDITPTGYPEAERLRDEPPLQRHPRGRGRPHPRGARPHTATGRRTPRLPRRQRQHRPLRRQAQLQYQLDPRPSGQRRFLARSARAWRVSCSACPPTARWTSTPASPSNTRSPAGMRRTRGKPTRASPSTSVSAGKWRCRSPSATTAPYAASTPAPSAPIAAQAQANYAKAPNALLPAALFQVRGGVTFAGQNSPRQLVDRRQTQLRAARRHRLALPQSHRDPRRLRHVFRHRPPERHPDRLQPEHVPGLLHQLRADLPGHHREPISPRASTSPQAVRSGS